MAKRVDYFSDESLRGDLKGKTVRGGAYTLIAQGGQMILQLAAVPLLARLLTPGDFGLVAMVTVLTNFAVMFVDAGLSMATVQRPNITRDEVTNLFWLTAALGSLIAAVVAALSPAIAWFYNEPRLVPITLALTLSLFMSGLTIQPLALLRRGMRFRAITVVQLLSVLTGQLVAILWAWQYHTYWALVWMPIVLTTVRAVGTWLVCGWWPQLPHRAANIWPLIGFGAHMTGFNFVNYFSRNMDYVLIGWYWGETPLGFYERAYKLLMQPLAQANVPMTAVAVPALSRLAQHPDRYRSFWRKGCSIAAFVQVPIVAWLALVAPQLVLFLLGPQWSESIKIFWALTPAMLISFTAPATSWVFVSWGRPDKQMKTAIAAAIVTLAGFAIAVPYGVIAVAWSFSITQWLIRLPTIMYCFAGTPLRMLDLWHAVRTPLYIGVVSTLVSLGIFAVVPIPKAPVTSLIVKSSVFGLAFFLSSLATPQARNLLHELWELTLPLMVRRSKA